MFVMLLLTNIWQLSLKILTEKSRFQMVNTKRLPKVNLKDFLSNCIICKLIICLLSKSENEKITSQIIEVSVVCDQNGDRMFKNDNIFHICSVRLKRTFT